MSLQPIQSKRVNILSYRFVLWFLFTAFIDSYSQVNIQGRITDAAYFTPVENVEVRLLRQGLTQYSDQLGDFLITNEEDADLLPLLKGTMAVRDGDLAWSFNTEIRLNVYNLQGQIVYAGQPKSQKYGRISLTRFQEGLFIVQVISQKGNRIYTLTKTHAGCVLGLYDNDFAVWDTDDPFSTDTLLFTREGYFSRKIPVTPEMNFLEVELLQEKYDELHYLNFLQNIQAYEMLASTPSSGHKGEVKSVKLIYDERADKIFFMNSRLHNNHYAFATEYLNYTLGKYAFLYQQYTNSTARYLFPATINYYLDPDLYTFEFFTGDEATCSQVLRLYNRLIDQTYMDGKLFFYASNDRWKNCSEVPSISSNELFAGQKYQAMNTGEAYGYLK